MFGRGTVPLNVGVAKKSHWIRASEKPKSVAISDLRIGSRQSLSIRGFFAIDLLLDGFRDDGPDDGGLATLVRVPNLGHANRDGFARAVDVMGFPFFRFGPVKQKLFHPVLRRIAHVNAQQIERFACRHPVLGRPRVVDGFEYFQFDYHSFSFCFFVICLSPPWWFFPMWTEASNQRVKQSRMACAIPMPFRAGLEPAFFSVPLNSIITPDVLAGLAGNN